VFQSALSVQLSISLDSIAVEFGMHQLKFKGPKNEIRDRETIMGIRVFILLLETEWGMAARWCESRSLIWALF
jgi:hypothetical protein